MVADELPLIADVAVDRPGRATYSYLVGDDLAPDLAVGDCVQVPFGRQRLRGFVWQLQRRVPPEGVRMKAILARQAHVRLPPHLLDLIAWGAAYYRCPVGTFLAGAVPAPVRAGTAIRPDRWVRRQGDFAGELTTRQREVLALLPLESIAMNAACERAGCSRGVIDRLIAAGALVLEESRDIREVRLASGEVRHPPTDEQAAVIAEVAAALHEHHAYLLYGVTGSGKTLVYMELAERVIASGRQVLLLLPEIGLTPQLAARFRTRFERVAVWHSAFSDGERSEQWRRVARGEVDLVLGTRSALFAPLPAPGLVVVDEEHDGSYKQDHAPRYHARDLAVVYARQLGVPVILGTATPSLESYHNVREARYRVLTLRQRPTGGRLPQPSVVDMAEECRRRGRAVPVSEELVQRLAGVKARGEQAIVLLNRRGWSPVVSCLACGQAIGCTSCDIALTYHKGEDALRCHYCGHLQTMPPACPTCGERALTTKGMGTEQLAAVLRADVPGLAVLRVDADTVATRQGHARLLQTFGNGEADCLVGTQMVAKGLDFPNVTLVGIVGADHGLAVPDFRAAERTFQLVAQVAGRAGRGESPGVVVVQAYDTEAPAIRCALDGKVKTFYTRELDLRRDYGYPPFAGLVRIAWRGADAGRVQLVAEAQGERLRAAAGDLPMLGPTPAGLHFLQGKYRWHALIKAGSRGIAQRFLDRLAADGGLAEERGVKVAVDVDPYVIN